VASATPTNPTGIATYPGEQYTPSSGTEGADFIDQWCGKCALDKAANGEKDFDACSDDELCQILAASFRGEAVEWSELEDGTLKCMKFDPLEKPTPRDLDDRTVDMFEVPA